MNSQTDREKKRENAKKSKTKQKNLPQNIPQAGQSSVPPEDFYPKHNPENAR